MKVFNALFLFSFSLTIASFAHANKLPSEFEVGVLYWSMDIPGQVAMRQGLEAEAARINKLSQENGLPTVKLVPHVAGNGSKGIENQIQQMNALIENNVDLIIAQPTDSVALSQSLIAANDKNIPVVAYDQYIAKGKLSAYLTSHNYQAGFYNGEFVASQFADDQILRIILVEYPHVSSTVERVDGFLDALGEHHQPFQLTKTYEAVEPTAGAIVAKKILNDFPEKGSFDVLFTVNDGGGLAVIEALQNNRRHEVVIASIDGDPTSVKQISQWPNPRIDSAQFCGPLGAESMKTAYKILLDKKVDEHILLPVFPITKKTLAKYPGWLGPIPKPFKKPWKSNQPQWQNTLTTY